MRNPVLTFSMVGVVCLLGLAACASSPSAPLVEAAPLDRGKATALGVAEPAIRAELSSKMAADASILGVTVQLSAEADPKDETQVIGVFNGKEFPFYPLKEEGPGMYGAVFAVPYLHPAGPASVEIRAGDKYRSTLSFNVEQRTYRSETLRVDPSKVTPPKDVLPRIKAESEQTRAIYREVTREKMWKGAFSLPVKSAITSPFGSQRVYNGELKGFHSGLDLRAAVGRRIRAPSHGRVVLTKDLYYTGNTVILDHGYGIYTVYAHMSRIDVKPGQTVKPRQILGLAGDTGRVNGPHLHWSVVVHGDRVDPLETTKVLR